jgi:hypothetical protein
VKLEDTKDGQDVVAAWTELGTVYYIKNATKLNAKVLEDNDKDNVEVPMKKRKEG